MLFDVAKQNLHPTAPVFGVVDKLAEIAPPNIRPVDGIVHVPSEIVKVVAVPALPSVGGALRHNERSHQKSSFIGELTEPGAAQV